MTIEATGSFAADEVSDVAPETSGQVAATPVDVGDRVERGAVIARLNTSDAQLRLDQARAGQQQAEAALAQARERHNLARATAARYEALVKTGDVSRTVAEQNTSESEMTRQGVATGEAAVADARSRVALAGKALADTVIRAPFTGFITELRVEIDRQRAADLGVSVAAISETLNFMMAGQEVTTFNAGKDQYDVVLRAQGVFRRDPENLRRMTVVTAGRSTVPLASVVRLEEGTGPASIERLNRERQVLLLANVAPGGSQTEVLEMLQQATTELRMEQGYSTGLVGQSKELQKAGRSFGIAVLLSFLFMYMVLAAQFESFIHPVTILLTLPLAVPFGLLSTLLAGQKLNIFSMLGILLLFGIVKKNAILQIDHTNELRQHGLSRYDAIIQANRNRLRPILMTTIALVAGMLPLVFGSGPGAATNRSIGVLVAGGQTLCLVLTLLAVPVFYSLFEDLGELTIWESGAERLRGLIPSRKAVARGTGAAVLAAALAVPVAAQVRRLRHRTNCRAHRCRRVSASFRAKPRP